jgi:hypothetical protein
MYESHLSSLQDVLPNTADKALHWFSFVLRKRFSRLPSASRTVPHSQKTQFYRENVELETIYNQFQSNAYIIVCGVYMEEIYNDTNSSYLWMVDYR